MDTQIAELSEDFASTLEGEEIDKYLHDDTYCAALDKTMVEQDKNTLFHFSIIKRW